MIHIRPVSDLRNKFAEVEHRLDEADHVAEATAKRYTGEEVFARVRERIHGRQEV